MTAAGTGGDGDPAALWRRLTAEAAGCRACPLYAGGTQTVFGAGPVPAPLVLVGEQPGDQEDRAGQPFVGPAGIVLDRALEEAGLDRGAVYVTNAVKHFKWKPRGKRRIHDKPNRAEVAACRPWLERELDLVSPQVVVALGATAAQSLLGGGFRLTRQQGVDLTDTGVAPHVVATTHPSLVLRAPSADVREQTRRRMVQDLAVAAELTRGRLKRGEPSVQSSSTVAPARRSGTGVSRLWSRQLDRYPDSGARYTYLAITVLVTVSLYYELYVNASVAPRQLPALHMSFAFLVNILAVANLIGAFGSLFAGLTDRIGRCNLVVGGLLVTGVLVAVVIPNLTSRWPFAIATAAVGLVEGICLVATPALIRDFSPQVGRATAMGFWTMGPVLGSLVVAVVASNTLHPSTSWGHEYVISGVVGLVVFAIALVGLRELSPALRDQLMVSMHDRALVEARARGIDVEASLRNPWRQLLRADVVVSALGVGVLLLIYYIAVGFGQTYLATVFGFSLKDANGLGNWNWAVNAVVVIIAGVASDLLRVRKPFMIVGGIGTAAMIVVYLEQAGHHPGYYTLAAIISILSAFLAIAYCPWMASFTETVEDHNPALTATGLAIWGWIIRVIVFVAYLILPHIVTTVNPLVNYGPQVQTYVAEYPAFLVPASTLHTLQKDPTNAAALAQAHAILGPKYISELIALTKAPAPVISYMTAHGPAVAEASTHSPGQWKDFYWICFGGAVAFLPAVLLMKGRWSPRQARADEAAHEAMVDAELARLQSGGHA